jgi:hypothetical protein
MKEDCRLTAIATNGCTDKFTVRETVPNLLRRAIGRYTTIHSFEVIYQTDRVLVCRAWESDASMPQTKKSSIVKLYLSTQESEVERLCFIQSFVEQSLPVQVPHILSTGHTRLSTKDKEQCVHWIEYEDAQMQPLPWNQVRILAAIKQLAELHKRGTRFTGDERLLERLRSHTPAVDAIQTELKAFGRSRFKAATIKWQIPYGARSRLLRLYDDAVFNWNAAHVPDTICHGDCHLGNILWSRERRHPMWIDWEYLHVNSPYFDLFQFLDATSPTTPLMRYASRIRVLRHYVKTKEPKWSSRARRAWVRGYYRYAILHLLWILTRIDADWSTGRFPQDQLSRQLSETVQALLCLERCLRNGPKRI